MWEGPSTIQEAFHRNVEAFPDRSGLWERLTWREIKVIVDRLARGLADFKRPRDIRFLEALPVTAMGKINKKEIRAGFFGK